MPDPPTGELRYGEPFTGRHPNPEPRYFCLPAGGWLISYLARTQPFCGPSRPQPLESLLYRLAELWVITVQGAPPRTLPSQAPRDCELGLRLRTTARLRVPQHQAQCSDHDSEHVPRAEQSDPTSDPSHNAREKMHVQTRQVSTGSCLATTSSRLPVGKPFVRRKVLPDAQQDSGGGESGEDRLTW